MKATDRQKTLPRQSGVGKGQRNPAAFLFQTQHDNLSFTPFLLVFMLGLYKQLFRLIHLDRVMGNPRWVAKVYTCRAGDPVEKFLSRHIMESVQDDIALVTLASPAFHAYGFCKPDHFTPCLSPGFLPWVLELKACRVSLGPGLPLAWFFMNWWSLCPCPALGKEGGRVALPLRTAGRATAASSWAWDSGRWPKEISLMGDLVSNQQPLLPPRDRRWEAQHC